MRIALLVVLGSLLPLSSVAAQEPTTATARFVPADVPAAAPPPATRAHIALPRPLVQTDHAAMMPTLRFSSPSGMSPALSRGTAMELAAERKVSVAGAVIGAVVGAAAGGALGCLANRDDYGVYCGGQSDTKVVVGAVIGAGIGGWLGGWVIPGRR